MIEMAGPLASAGRMTHGTAKAAMTKGAIAKGVVAGAPWLGGKGLCLGLGIGLGVWGPLALVGLGAAAAYTLCKSRHAAKSLENHNEYVPEGAG
ncbi:conserved protein of unknown function [Rhodovastum atsumiense]|uniref:Uncharacterized protein n=1 Tax=Rhodovastum atsumiense TaxID=504468 RepID=A0A5M6IQ25_9PROT|nr:hypothetical protein [Rhodovastum atsumiense]KAA5610007.1 hypothetical protein F1189_21665 [Rhodovastum atsumiense]CAH2598652.1 conserved protein of unknown function [Rhodovastum atsumiense]